MTASRIRYRALLPLASGALLGSVASGQSLLYQHNGAAQYDRLGAGVGPVGDVNADGKIDYAVGAPENFQILFAGPGYVRVYSGSTGTILRTLTGLTDGEDFGTTLSDAGDVNNDNVADMIVGAPHNSDAGSFVGHARVFSGSTGALLWQVTGVGSEDEYGRAVCGAGDINGDSRDDFAVGGPGTDAAGNNSGVVKIHSGMTGAVLRTINGSGLNKFFGASLARLGDLDNDGFDEIVAGSWFDGVRVYRGSNGTVLHFFPSPGQSHFFGWAVARLNDLNSDGVADILIGATQDDILSPGVGYAQVRSGSNGQLLFTVNGTSVGDRFGYSVTGLGDWNADGIPDFAVGADQPLGNGVGYVRVYSGANGLQLHNFNGAGDQARLGTAIAGLGDVNNDSKTEIALGEPGASPAGTASGKLYVYSGLEGGGGGCPAPSTYCVTSPNSAGAGSNISTAGSNSVAADNFILLAGQCPPNQNGIFFYGPNQIQFPFGDGFRCVGAGGAAVFRLPITNTGPAGLAVHQLDYDNLPTGGELGPFDVTNFQFWYRDPGFGNFGFNLSNAVHVQFCP